MNLSALTVQQLRYLIALDGLRSFRDAAVACHVSQPALSAQVKKVEDLLGLCLFDRSRQPILPTEQGVKVLIQVRRALEQFDRIAVIAAESNELDGPFRLGVMPTLASTLLPLFVPLFVHRHPRVALEILETKTEPMIRALREGGLDAGLAALPLGFPGIREHVICRETLHVYLPVGHRLCAQTSVLQTDLLDEQLWLLNEGHCSRTQMLTLCNVRRVALASLAKLDIDVGSFETLVGFVDAGLGVTIVPELFVRRLSPAQRAKQVRCFHAPEPVREIGFLSAREHLRWGAFSALLRAAHDMIPSDLSKQPAAEAIHVMSPATSEGQNVSEA
jgi:LysR family hydrogen peroxide-inducible transcriptional activator